MSFVRLLLAAAMMTAGVLPAATPALEAALTLKSEKRYPEARAALEAVVAAEPTNAAACYHLGLVLGLRNDSAAYGEAVKWLAKAVELDPKNASYLADYGGASLQYANRARSYSAATTGRDALEKAVALDPDQLDARQGLFEFYHHAPWPLGSSAKAATQLAEIRRRDPDRATTIEVASHTQKKDFAGAFRVCDEVLKRQPGDYTALFQYGRVAAVSGQNLALGLSRLKTCVALEPPRASAARRDVVWFHIGQIEQKLNRPDAAREAYTSALTLNPGNRRAAEALAQLK
jgi:tetratricopeptide (TPR) repeat protein